MIDVPEPRKVMPDPKLAEPNSRSASSPSSSIPPLIICEENLAVSRTVHGKDTPLAVKARTRNPPARALPTRVTSLQMSGAKHAAPCSPRRGVTPTRPRRRNIF